MAIQTIFDHKELVKLIADGNRDLDIANKLDINTDTVSRRIHTLFKHYKCKNRAHLVAYFLRTERIS